MYRLTTQRTATRRSVAPQVVIVAKRTAEAAKPATLLASRPATLFLGTSTLKATQKLAKTVAASPALVAQYRRFASSLQPLVFTTQFKRQFSTSGYRRSEKQEGAKSQAGPEVDAEFAADPVATLPPELQPLEPLSTTVKLSILVALLLIAVAVPWGSFVDHIIFPPEDDDDD